MPGFDEDSAKRIAQSVRYTERLQGVPSTDPNENYGTAIGGQICLVQTDATLPAGYNGAMGAPGQVIEKQPDNTINKLGAVWLKDINGGTLSANTIYQARIGGTWTQDVTTNNIVKPTTLGLYLVQGINNSRITVRPKRWAYLEGKGKSGVTYYLRAVVWADPSYNPDKDDVPVYVDSSMFTMKGYTEPNATKYIADTSYWASAEVNNCFCEFKIDGKVSLSWADIETTPTLLCNEMGSPYFDFMPSDLTGIPDYFIYTYNDRADIPTEFLFTRRNLSDKDGPKKTIVQYINTNIAKQIGNFISAPWSFTEKITTYKENQYGTYQWGGGVSYIEKTVNWENKKTTLIVTDDFGLGYLKQGQPYYNFRSKYLFGPISYSDSVRYLPIQVLHANSPLHPINATTTGGIGSGISTGISGV